MIEAVQQEVARCLPLTVKAIDWQDPVLVLSGKEWNLTCSCAWRVSTNGAVRYGCWDKEAGERILDLIGVEFLGVEQQATAVPVDLAFLLSDGGRLELFSTDTTEPWVLRLPTGDVLVASPSDPDAF